MEKENAIVWIPISQSGQKKTNFSVTDSKERSVHSPPPPDRLTLLSMGAPGKEAEHLQFIPQSRDVPKRRNRTHTKSIFKPCFNNKWLVQMESSISIKGKPHRTGAVGGNILEEILWDPAYRRHPSHRPPFFLIDHIHHLFSWQDDDGGLTPSHTLFSGLAEEREMSKVGDKR